MAYLVDFITPGTEREKVWVNPDNVQFIRPDRRNPNSVIHFGDDNPLLVIGTVDEVAAKMSKVLKVSSSK